MGHVFTLEEFSEGRIPDIKDYEKAIKMLREELGRMHDEGLVEAANIHGSSLHKPEIGSDVDVMVITDSHRWVHAEDSLNCLNADVKQRTNVPVEFVPCTGDVAGDGLHPFDWYYVDYISSCCSDGIVGKNPVPLIGRKGSWDSPEREVMERLSTQLGKLSKNRANIPRDYEERHCSYIEQLIRHPIYAAIDMLRVRSGSYPTVDGRPMSKGECCQAFADEFPEIQCDDVFTVLRIRERYRKLLTEWEGMGIDDYVSALDAMWKAYPNAVRTMQTVLQYLESRHH